SRMRLVDKMPVPEQRNVIENASRRQNAGARTKKCHREEVSKTKGKCKSMKMSSRRGFEDKRQVPEQRNAIDKSTRGQLTSARA
ncbi:hypothetical protein, partial [Pallidibacillus pasinlerensis]|uniref:hypothetical protein n=1 Tax=Pallidibacillus pasinlerensis TaxID=2703818 RepID=UPI001AED3B68